MNLAPIALFVYNRPQHTRRTVEALLNNAEAAQTALYVFSDGPRNEAARESVAEVRSYIRSIAGFKSVAITEREINFGLARSIIDGVTKVCEQYGRVIVVEDDLVTSPFFLAYMNEALDLYEHEEKVISIHGYVYPLKGTLPETFFIKGADCWGWATWKRGWELFEPDGSALLQELTQRRLTRCFDFDGTYPYINMLKSQIKGKNNSWAVRWYASAFLKDRLTLYPGRSLVRNIGHDSSGRHSSTTNAFAGAIADSRVAVERIAIEENVEARQRIAEFFQTGLPKLPERIVHKLTDLARRTMRKFGMRA